MAKILGFKDDEAIRFSFLLAIPSILGATVLEILNLTPAKIDISLTHYSLGFFASLAFGLLSINVLKRLGTMKTLFRYFALYCTILGGLCLWLR